MWSGIEDPGWTERHGKGIGDMRYNPWEVCGREEGRLQEGLELQRLLLI